MKNTVNKYLKKVTPLSAVLLVLVVGMVAYGVYHKKQMDAAADTKGDEITDESAPTKEGAAAPTQTTPTVDTPKFAYVSNGYGSVQGIVATN